MYILGFIIVALVLLGIVVVAYIASLLRRIEHLRREIDRLEGAYVAGDIEEDKESDSFG